MTSFFIHLVQKIHLAHDVYELIYTIQEPVNILPGQFLLCETDAHHPRLRRAYSVSYSDAKNIHFIIKKIPDGKGGSKAICDQEIGHSMQVWWPTGSFVLPSVKTSEPIIFIGTGTGFAPLYFQARTLLEKNPLQKISFIFGVREQKDLFYADEFLTWTQKYPHFLRQFCLSQPEAELPSEYYSGRVTGYLREAIEYLNQDTPLYSICGSPAMVMEVREILGKIWIDTWKVFFEQY